MRGFCLIVLCAALMAGCSSRPSGELWPNQAIVLDDRWQPELTAVENLDEWAEVIDVRRGRDGDQTTAVIENLDPDRPITVYYIDRNGSYQVIPIDAGGTQAVAQAPRHIMRVQ